MYHFHSEGKLPYCPTGIFAPEPPLLNLIRNHLEKGVNLEIAIFHITIFSTDILMILYYCE